MFTDGTDKVERALSSRAVARDRRGEGYRRRSGRRRARLLRDSRNYQRYRDTRRAPDVLQLQGCLDGRPRRHRGDGGGDRLLLRGRDHEADFEPYFCIQNPSGDEAQVKITYMRGTGAVEEQELAVGAASRATVDIGSVLGSSDDAASDFSAHVRSTNGTGIVVERPMYFNYKGFWTGGHNVMGATATSEAFYFAEGSTRPGLDPYFCIQNPGAEAPTSGSPTSSLTAPRRRKPLRYPRPRGTRLTRSRAWGARMNRSTTSRRRSSRWTAARSWSSARCTSSTRGPGPAATTWWAPPSPAEVFYFAEGTCRPDFEPYFCLQNPGTEDVDVAITYYLGTGDNKNQELEVPAASRSTVIVKEFLGEGDDPEHDFSATVTEHRWRRHSRGAPDVLQLSRVHGPAATM